MSDIVANLTNLNWESDTSPSLAPQGQEETCEEIVKSESLGDLTDLVEEFTCQVFHGPYPYPPLRDTSQEFTQDTQDHLFKIPFVPVVVQEPIDYDDLLALEDIFAGWNAAMSPLLWKMPNFNELQRATFCPEVIGEELIEKFKRSWRYPDSNVNILPRPVSVTALDPTISSARKIWEYPCEICGVKLKGGMQRYEAHKKNAHDLSCICGEKFRHRLTLTSHLKKSKDAAGKHGMVTGEKVKALYECDICDEFFRSSATATRHRNKMHLSEIGKPSPAKKQPKRSRAKKGKKSPVKNERKKKENPETKRVTRKPKIADKADKVNKIQ